MYILFFNWSIIDLRGSDIQQSDSVTLVAQLVKNLPAMWETWVWSLGWEDTLGKGKCSPLQYSGLENSLDCLVHGVTKSQTWLRDFHFLFHVYIIYILFHILFHYRLLWDIKYSSLCYTVGPYCLSILHIVVWVSPTPVFLPGESQGRGSLVGCCLWGRTELDTTEVN